MVTNSERYDLASFDFKESQSLSLIKEIAVSDLTHGEVVSENKKQRFSKTAAHVKILPPSSSGRALP